MNINKDFLCGMRSAFPIVLAYLPLGFAFGVLAVKNGVPEYIAIMMSLCVFAGSGQFIAASLIGSGASIFTICLTNFVINLRYMLMSAALATQVGYLSKKMRTLFALEITDEVFAIHSANFKQRTNISWHELFGVNLTAHLGWILGTMLGTFSSGFVADVKPFGLDFALSAMFIAILVPMCLERLYLVMAILSAILSVSFVLLGMNRWNVILATIIVASIGAWFSMRQNNSDGKVQNTKLGSGS